MGRHADPTPHRRRPAPPVLIGAGTAAVLAARAVTTKLTDVGSMATSPVVLATSKEAVDQLGWVHTPPTWGAALTTAHAVAVPDLAGSAEGLSALAAVRASLGGGANADNAV